MSRNFVRLSAAAFVIATAACAPVNSYSGFSAERNNIAIQDPQPGVDTRETVQQRFGSPSTTAVFDQTAWYYVSQTQEQVAFYRPRITQRQVMVVRFNGETVSAVEKYGMERGRLVAYDSHETPTRGRELGIIEQLFGNIGTTPPIRGQEDQQGGRPR